MADKLNADKASAQPHVFQLSLFMLWFSLPPPPSFFLTSLVQVMKTEYAFCLQQEFFSADQLPLTGVGDPGTRMGCNPQRTEIRKSWWLNYWLIQEQSTLTPSCLQQLWCFDILLLSCKEQDNTCAYSCSRGWFGVVLLEAPRVLHTYLVKVAVLWDISLAGRSVRGQGHPPCSSTEPWTIQLESRTCLSGWGESQHLGETH